MRIKAKGTNIFNVYSLQLALCIVPYTLVSGNLPYPAWTMHYDLQDESCMQLQPIGNTNQAIKVLHFLTKRSFGILLLISTILSKNVPQKGHSGHSLSKQPRANKVKPFFVRTLISTMKNIIFQIFFARYVTKVDFLVF